MTSPKIAFFDAKPYDKEYFERANKSYNYEITYFDPHLTAHTLPMVEGFNTVCVFINDHLTAEVIEGLK
jgi:D-lactate dehydrogenase